MEMQDLEFSISQYLDGTLGESERVALEAKLKTDAAAEALLVEYRALDQTLRLCRCLRYSGINWPRCCRLR